MNRHIHISVLIIFIFLLQSINGQTTGWQVKNPLPQKNTYSIKFLNSNTGYGVGEEGMIYKTTNGGQSWVFLASAVNKSLYSLYFFDISNGFAVGDTGTILKTSNGGNNWILLNGNTVENLKSVNFYNSNVGIISGSNGTILRTSNGGINWQSQSVGTNILNSIFFLNVDTIFISGNASTLLKSVNSGLNWTPVNAPGNDLRESWFINSSTGYAGTSIGMYKTTNGGANWSAQQIQYSSQPNIYSVKFINTNTGFAAGKDMPIAKTTNGGVNWNVTSMPVFQPFIFYSISIADTSVFYIGGSEGYILKSTNSGNLWGTIGGTKHSLVSVTSSPSNNWAAIGNSNQYLFTSNTGSSWNVTTSGDNNFFEPQVVQYRKVILTPSGTGYLSIKQISSGPGSFGFVIQRTTDEGMTWSLSGGLTGTLADILDITAVENRAYLIRYAGTYSVWRSDNGGSWSNIFTTTGFQPMSGLSFANINTGISYGTNSIWRTTNGGLNWASIPVTSNGNFQMMPSGIAYLINSGGVILKSTDFGLSWNQLSNNLGSGIGNFFFTNENRGWAVGNSGKIVYTVNGGIYWTTQQSGTLQNLNSIYSNDGVNVIAAGDSGTVLYSPSYGQPVFSISGLVKFQDNGLPVTSGYVKAVKYDNGDVITLDSASIMANGFYTLTKVPQDSVDLVAFQNDEEDLQFVPTYYQSTIFWENANTLYPISNLTNIDISVHRINNLDNSSWKISGRVTASSDSSYIKDAIIYAKIGNIYKGYSVSVTDGTYEIDSLTTGNYQLICNRMGYETQYRNVTVSGGNLSNINFLLNYYIISAKVLGTEVPENYYITQNYPNPFNPVTYFNFGIPEKSNVKLVIYDILGREAATLINSELDAGSYKVDWNADNFASGVYFYKFSAGSLMETRKLVLVK